jgi:hypothetical protein
MKHSILEDKSVKFGGEAYPKSGWAVFMAGGPGASKSTTIKNQLLIDGTVLDNDKIIEYYINYAKNLYNSNNLNEEKKKELEDIFGDVNSADLKNPEFNSNIYDKIENKKFFSERLSLFLKDNLHFLNNIIIDTTSNNLNKLIINAEQLKTIGYKIALIWVISSVNNAIKRNANRNRRIDIDYLIDVHKNILSSLPVAFSDGTLSLINEIWIVFSDNISDFSKSFSEKYANTAFKLDNENGKFFVSDKLRKRIIYTVDKEHINENDMGD